MESTNEEIYFPIFMKHETDGSCLKIFNYWRYSMVKVQLPPSNQEKPGKRVYYYSLVIVHDCPRSETESVLALPGYAVCSEEEYMKCVLEYAKNSEKIIETLTKVKS